VPDEQTAYIRFIDFRKKYESKTRNKNKFFLILKPIGKSKSEAKKISTTKDLKQMEAQDKITKEYRTTDNNYFPCTIEGWEKAVEHQLSIEMVDDRY
jgi:hypothetical protein